MPEFKSGFGEKKTELMSGYAEKKNRFGTWNKRYFVLLSEDHYLVITDIIFFVFVVVGVVGFSTKDRMNSNSLLD
jgi:hypothetical protein